MCCLLLLIILAFTVFTAIWAVLWMTFIGILWYALIGVVIGAVVLAVIDFVYYLCKGHSLHLKERTKGHIHKPHYRPKSKNGKHFKNKVKHIIHSRRFKKIFEWILIIYVIMWIITLIAIFCGMNLN